MSRVSVPSPAPPPVSERNLAARTARRIERMIIERGWPVGAVLGSEASLTGQLGVGRSVLREAVRLLEAEGVARRRPGPGGGLVVTAPDADAVLGAARLFLDYRGVRIRDLCEVWVALETAAVARLAESIDAEGATRLRAVLAASGEADCPDPAEIPNIHVEMARMSGNPAAELFLRVVAQLCLDYGVRRLSVAERAWLHRRHTEIVEAVVAGDGALAQQYVRRYIERILALGGLPGRRNADGIEPTGPTGPDQAKG
ncbi:GntR family transcriptional regulator [Yinghuangia sp. ASG 101]|uniref:FadR/GntR family transcriptional regulator n=1 Tax=Yinghuangia sp. ASG 101 TaxID=2896848 RepID=UPI001E4657AF|nr:FCD domain-containing protein [Yinghuangia sp. ASG 101]UGQ11198.1 GntR family transcriptional regulator [Yinghuangia sp. ASG 101]